MELLLSANPAEITGALRMGDVVGAFVKAVAGGNVASGLQLVPVANEYIGSVQAVLREWLAEKESNLTAEQMLSMNAFYSEIWGRVLALGATQTRGELHFTSSTNARSIARMGVGLSAGYGPLGFQAAGDFDYDTAKDVGSMSELRMDVVTETMITLESGWTGAAVTVATAKFPTPELQQAAVALMQAQAAKMSGQAVDTNILSLIPGKAAKIAMPSLPQSRDDDDVTLLIRQVCQEVLANTAEFGMELKFQVQMSGRLVVAEGRGGLFNLFRIHSTTTESTEMIRVEGHPDSRIYDEYLAIDIKHTEATEEEREEAKHAIRRILRDSVDLRKVPPHAQPWEQTEIPNWPHALSIALREIAYGKTCRQLDMETLVWLRCGVAMLIKDEAEE